MITDKDTVAKRQLARRAIKDEGKWWSDGQKLEAVKTFLVTGNVAMTARILKIPEDTLRRWVKTVWWTEIVADLRTQDELQLSTRFKKIVEKTLEVVEDRLEHGDFVYDQKTGAMRRKPVAMRDAHKVGLDLDAKRDLILGRQAPAASNEQIDAKLSKLAQSFADIVNGRKAINTSDAIDVEVKESNSAVDEGWEEGLQEGVCEVSGDAGTEASEVGEDGFEESSQLDGDDAQG